MNIGIDLDGVVADTVTLMQARAVELGVPFVFDQYHPDIDGVEDNRKFVQDIVDDIFTNDMDKIHPYNDAIICIPTIIRYLGAVTFVTARKKRYSEATIKWISYHFPLEFDLVNKPAADKPQFVLDNDFDVFVEDRLKTANRAGELGIRTYLISRRWNIGRPVHPDVIRVNTLAGFYSREVSR